MTLFPKLSLPVDQSMTVHMYIDFQMFFLSRNTLNNGDGEQTPVNYYMLIFEMQTVTSLVVS